MSCFLKIIQLFIYFTSKRSLGSQNCAFINKVQIELAILMINIIIKIN